MLHFFSGTDREKARAEMNKEIARAAKKKARLVRVTDANNVADLSAALRGGGMFKEERVVVLEGLVDNDEMCDIALDALPLMKASAEHFFMYEEKPDAA